MVMIFYYILTFLMLWIGVCDIARTFDKNNPIHRFSMVSRIAYYITKCAMDLIVITVGFIFLVEAILNS